MSSVSTRCYINAGSIIGINSALEWRYGGEKSFGGENEVKEFDKLQLWLRFEKVMLGLLNSCQAAPSSLMSFSELCQHSCLCDCMKNQN